MRSLLGLSFLLLAVGCSNACPPPVLCSQPHPDNCPCNIDDAGSTPRLDAFVDPDAFVDVDADVDADVRDTGPSDDAASDDAGGDTGVDAH